MTDESDRRMHFLVSARSGRLLDLAMDQNILIGRSAGSAIRVNDFQVSRQHAELYWDGGCFVLNDLQSSNGTWVNGERVESRELQDGDSIEIGAESFVYRIASNRQRLELMRQKIRRDTSRLGTEQRPELQIDLSGEELSGTLKSVGILELVQMLHQSHRTGLLVVRGHLGKALVYFFKGEATQAEHFLAGGEVLLGDEAVLSMLKETDGAFVFKPDRQGVSDNVEKGLTYLLFEAARQVDEG